MNPNRHTRQLVFAGRFPARNLPGYCRQCGFRNAPFLFCLECSELRLGQIVEPRVSAILAAADQLLIEGRLPETPAEITARAFDLITRYGFDGGGFGESATGFSLEGAVYEALRLRVDFFGLRDVSPAEEYLYALADEVFALLLTSTAQVVPAARYRLRAVAALSTEWSDISQKVSGRRRSLNLLATVFQTLTDTAQVAA